MQTVQFVIWLLSMRVSYHHFMFCSSPHISLLQGCISEPSIHSGPTSASSDVRRGFEGQDGATNAVSAHLSTLYGLGSCCIATMPADTQLGRPANDDAETARWNSNDAEARTTVPDQGCSIGANGNAADAEAQGFAYMDASDDGRPTVTCPEVSFCSTPPVTRPPCTFLPSR